MNIVLAIANSILVRSYTDHEIISISGHSPPVFAVTRRVVVYYKQKYVHEVLVWLTADSSMYRKKCGR